MQKVALQWIAYQLTHSALILGLIGVFQFTPVLLFALFAGVIIDRFPKREFLILTQTAQMILVFILTFLIYSGEIRYWHILILVFLQGVITSFDMPARHSFHIELVGKEDLVDAVGLNWTVANIARIIGPVLAGICLTFFGATICFLINGLSFIAPIICLCVIKTYRANIRKKSESILFEILSGFNYIFSKRILLDAIIAMLIIGTLAMNVDVFMPVFAKEVLNQGAGGYSLMFSSIGIGALLGSVLFTIKGKELTCKRMLLTSAVFLCLSLIILSFVRIYVIVLILLALIGFFQNVFITIVNSTVQLYSTDEIRGRSMSIYTLVMSGTTPLGNLLTGIVMQNYGAKVVFLLCGVLSMIFLFPMFFSKQRSGEQADLGKSV